MGDIAVDPGSSICTSCEGRSQIIVDHCSGDLICTSCGLVLAERCLDEGQEWRSFAPDSVGTGQDINARERGDFSTAHDAMDSNFMIGTTITGGGAVAQALQRAHMMAESRATTKALACADEAAALERQLKEYTKKVRDVATRMSLGESIVRRCVGFMQDLAEKNKLRGRALISFFAALVALASQVERAARTTRELAEVLTRAAGKGSTEKMERDIERRLRHLRHDLGMGTTFLYEDEDLIGRFVSRLHLPSTVCRPALYVAGQVYEQELVSNFSQNSQAAVIATAIYVVSRLVGAHEAPSVADVAAAAKVKDVDIKRAYKAVHGRLRYLLPAGFKAIDMVPNPV